MDSFCVSAGIGKYALVTTRETYAKFKEVSQILRRLKEDAYEY